MRRSYYFFAVTLKDDGMLVLDDPLSGTPRIYNNCRPKTVSQLLEYLKERGFGQQRLVKCASAEESALAGDYEVRTAKYVLVEKALVPEVKSSWREAVIAKAKTDAQSVVKWPLCCVCSKSMTHGMRCTQCEREYCVTCEPDLYWVDVDGTPDWAFALRIVLRPRCNTCLHI